MGRYARGEVVKFAAKDTHCGEGEWMWLLVLDSDDYAPLVFASLDRQPRPYSTCTSERHWLST